MRKALIGGFNLILVSGASQIVVQAAQFAGGILTVRILSAQDYALFTMANAVLGVMNLVSNGGISSAVMAEGGRVWKSPSMLGRVIATGLALRRRFAIGAMVVILPILVCMLHAHGAGVWLAIAITACVGLIFLTALELSLYSIVPKLHQEIGKISRINAAQSSFRLGVLSAALLTMPGVISALLPNIISQWWTARQMRELARNHALLGESEDAGIRAKVMGIIRRILPGDIYAAVSGQISVWLLSVFATTTAIAQLGALGRIGQIFQLFAFLGSCLILPRFSRHAGHGRVLRNWYVTAGLLFTCACMSLVLLAALFPAFLLALLGAKYANLGAELPWMVFNSSVSVLLGFVFTLNASRGWVFSPWILIMLSLIAQIIAIIFCDISSVKGVIQVSLATTLVPLVCHIIYGIIRSGAESPRLEN